MSNNTTDTDDEEVLHTCMHVNCDECGGVDVLTVLEHPQDSKQVDVVSEAHHEMAQSHAQDTGHHVEVGITDNNPEEILEFARGIAPSVSGAAPEDFLEVEA